MTEFMSQPGFGLTAPSSRQDVISALLNDYGNSFGRGDMSPYVYSPGFKELPPPPPEKDESPLSLMNMKFQLRVDEPQSPISYNGNRKNSLGSSPPSPPTKIVYRSLSRSSKPRSLKLIVSNGSTAVVPPTPSMPAPSTVLPSSTISKPLPNPFPEPAAAEERPLPPPPPEKSSRRQQSAMGSIVSKSLRDRKDSVESQDVASQEQSDSASRSSPVVKRKAVPESTKKFKSLADLGVGPRGGKNGPLPPMPPASKNSSNDSVTTITPASVAQEKTSKPSNRSLSVEEISRKPLPELRPTVSSAEAPARLPPTPDEPLPDMGPPAPPKKAWTVGLPSNPRARGQETPTSAKHQRGKSSTGFDLMNSKANTENESARPGNLTTITPGPTPSPNKTTTVQAQGSTFPNVKDLQSPVSPIANDNSRRPFSYEAIAKPPPQPQEQLPPRAESAQSYQSISPVAPPAATITFPPRSTSRPYEAIAKQPPQPQEQLPPRAESAQSYQSTSPVAPPAVTITFPPRSTSRPEQPKAFAQIQQQQTSRSPSPPNLDSPPSTLNIVKPSPSAAAAITNKHLSCYAHHSSYVWSKNECQPMACMVCHENDRERKWACTWCYLRVCLACSDELMRTPGRDLRPVMEKRGRGVERSKVGRDGTDGREGSRSRNGSAPQMVIWEVENEDGKED